MVSEEEFKLFENTYKKILFEKIRNTKEAELILLIQKNASLVDCKLELPNGFTRLNNKIVDLTHEFEKAGVSLFAEKIEDYGPAKLNFVGSSFTGNAIIMDLIDQATENNHVLSDIAKKVNEMGSKKVDRINQLANVSPVKNFFLKIRSYFVKPKIETFNITDQDRQELHDIVLDYNNRVNKLTDYNLKDNIVDAVIKQIKGKGYSKENALGILDENVQPVFEKLGFDELVPEMYDRVKNLSEQELELSDEDFRKTLRTNESYIEQNEQSKFLQEKLKQNEQEKDINNVEQEK